MSTPDQRARDKDRDAAIEVVEAAWADGQIVEADRDHRVAALLRAQTLAEVSMITHDLQLPAAPVAAVAPVAAAAPAAPAAPHPYANPAALTAGRPPTTPAPAAPGRAAGCFVVAIVSVVLLVMGVAVVGILATSSSVDDEFSEVWEAPLPGAQPDRGVNVLSERGYRALLRDVEDTTGSTDAFEGVLYPEYAVVYLPVDATSQRTSYWYWDGTLEDLDSRSTSSYERFDLADVDMKVVVRLVKRARGMVEEPTSFYAIVRAPDAEDGAAIWAYASNEFQESAYVSATATGRVVYESTPD